MALDRFIIWDRRKKKPPTKAEIQIVLEDFLKGLGTVEWHEDGHRFMCRLVGETSHPLNRIEDAMKMPGEGGVRTIEVMPMTDSLDVITRHQDEVTNSIAQGIAALFARFWRGRLQEG